jgi:hypothetical protein
MIFSIRLFLVTCLVVLQFIAPLVHAHTSEKILAQGLHIPGLEVYGRSVAQETLNTTKLANALSCKVTLFCGNIDGQVVGVDAGFSRNRVISIHKPYKIITDLHNSYYLPAHAVLFETSFSAFFIRLPTQVKLLPGQLSYFLHSPRAPPTHA